MRRQGRVGRGVVVGGEVETRELSGGETLAALDRIQRDVVLAYCVLGRQLSFLCGRRREGELQLCSSGIRVGEGSWMGREAQRQPGRRGRMEV
jgi:hypothetical protein